MKWTDSETRPDAAATAEAGWFGPADRRRFGWLHRPAGAARALVVVCPSFGQEAVFAHHPLRSVADELAARGTVVVRFDYDGTGDSQGGLHDPDRVDAWVDSIADAVALGRRHTDAPLVLVGFRLGALLAARAAASAVGDVHGLVLWDAPRSGRHWLRELAVRQNVSVGHADTGVAGFTALGVSLAEDARAAVSALGLRGVAALPADVVLTLERPGPAGVGDVTTRTGAAITRLPAPDQDDLLSRQAVPTVTRATLVDWVLATYAHASHAVITAPGALTPQLVTDGVRERVTEVGPHRLFGIVTEAADGPGPDSTVVFVPDSITPHGGLSRAWTDLARQWAGGGVRSLRFDLSGCADSPARDGAPAQTVGLLEHLDDTLDAVRHADPARPGDTVLVGLCSGAYLATEAALALRTRGLAIVNPVLSFITPEAQPDPRRRAIVLTRRALHRVFGRLAGRLAVRLARTNQTPAFTNDPNFAWDRAFEACFWQVYLHTVAPWAPDRVWRWVNRLLTTTPGLDRVLGAAHTQGTEVFLLAGDPDFDRATLGARRHLAAAGVRSEYQPGLDHAMMRPGAKDGVTSSLTRFVLDLTASADAVSAEPVPAEPVLSGEVA